MQFVTQFENLARFRDEPGKIPLPVLLRNAAADAVFYETRGLTTTEQAELLAQSFVYDEGGMLVVFPSAARKPIAYFPLSASLVEAHPEVDTIAIPGVGSSPLGAAAFARQVADAVGRPVVGVIAGYGLADVASEALGGWFDFGLRNRLHSLFSSVRRRAEPLEARRDAELRRAYRVLSTAHIVDEPESNTIINLMLRLGSGIRLVAGHSKGALNIQNALRAVVAETDRAADTFAETLVVTFGCAVSLPESFSNVHQYLGTADLLGRLNSPLSAQTDPSLRRVAGRAHTLVRANPFHMPAAAALRGILRGDPRWRQPEIRLPGAQLAA